jgi:hypothetical protein
LRRRWREARGHGDLDIARLRGRDEGRDPRPHTLGRGHARLEVEVFGAAVLGHGDGWLGVV